MNQYLAAGSIDVLRLHVAPVVLGAGERLFEGIGDYPDRMPEPTTLGAQFARALAVKDYDRVRELMHPEIDFRGLTPRRNWEASDADAVISGVLREWFEESDEIEALEQLECDGFADRERVGYRFSVRNPDGRFLVEQQAYLAARDGRIGWMRVVCSGFRPAA